MTPKQYLDNIRNCDREINEKQESLDVMWGSIKSIQSSHINKNINLTDSELLTFTHKIVKNNVIYYKEK